MNERLLHTMINQGAVKLPELVQPTELYRLQDSPPLYMKRLQLIAPVLGEFITRLTGGIPESITTLSLEPISAQRSSDLYGSLHIDSNITHGLSVLLPLTGPNADFCFADEPLKMRHALTQADQFSYGPGDAALIRQKIEYNDGESYKVVPQIYHAGIAFEPRDLLICDVYFEDTLHVPNRLLTEVVA